MGSKNKIANWVVDVLPKAEHLYDLFCGGCAVTHAAMMRSKYQHYHVNDINNIGGAFCDIIRGKLQPDYRWVSREEFHRLKDTDPLVKIVWSFGNNGRDYLYGKDREELKKAMHMAVVFGDYSMSDAFGIDLHSLSQYEDLGERYKAYKQLYHAHFNKTDKTPPPPITLSGIYSEELQSILNANRVIEIFQSVLSLKKKQQSQTARNRANLANVERMAQLVKLGGAVWAA